MTSIEKPFSVDYSSPPTIAPIAPKKNEKIPKKTQRILQEIQGQPQSGVKDLVHLKRQVLEFKKNASFFQKLWFFWIGGLERKVHRAVEQRWESEFLGISKYVWREKRDDGRIEPISEADLSQLEATFTKDWFKDFITYINLDEQLHLTSEQQETLASSIMERLSGQQKIQFLQKIFTGNLSDLIALITHQAEFDTDMRALITRSGSVEQKMLLEEPHMQSEREKRASIHKIQTELAELEKIQSILERSSTPLSKLKEAAFESIKESFFIHKKTEILQQLCTKAGEQNIFEAGFITDDPSILVEKLLKKGGEKSIEEFISKNREFSNTRVLIGNFNVLISDLLPLLLKELDDNANKAKESEKRLGKATEEYLSHEPEAEVVPKLLSLVSGEISAVWEKSLLESAQAAEEAIATEKEAEKEKRTYTPSPSLLDLKKIIDKKGSFVQKSISIETLFRMQNQVQASLELISSQISHLHRLEAKAKLSEKKLERTPSIHTVEGFENLPFAYTVSFREEKVYPSSFDEKTHTEKNRDYRTTCVDLIIDDPLDPERHFIYTVPVDAKKGEVFHLTELPETPQEVRLVPGEKTLRKQLVDLPENSDAAKVYKAIKKYIDFVQENKKTKAPVKIEDLDALVSTNIPITYAAFYDEESTTTGKIIILSKNDPSSLHTYTFTVPPQDAAASSSQRPIISITTNSDEDAFFFEQMKKIAKGADKASENPYAVLKDEFVPDLHGIPHIVVKGEKGKQVKLFDGDKMFTYNVSERSIEPEPHSDHTARLFLAKLLFRSGNIPLLAKVMEPVSSYPIGEAAPKTKGQESAEVVGEATIPYLREIFETKDVYDLTLIATQIRAGVLLKKFKRLDDPDRLAALRSYAPILQTKGPQASLFQLTLEELGPFASRPSKTEQAAQAAPSEGTAPPLKTIPDLTLKSSLQQIDSAFSIEFLKPIHDSLPPLEQVLNTPNVSIAHLKEASSKFLRDSKIENAIKTTSDKKKDLLTQIQRSLGKEYTLDEIKDLYAQESPLIESQKTNVWKILELEQNLSTLEKLYTASKSCAETGSLDSKQILQETLPDLYKKSLTQEQDLAIRKKVFDLKASLLPKALQIKGTYYTLLEKLNIAVGIKAHIQDFISQKQLVKLLELPEQERTVVIESFFNAMRGSISDSALCERFISNIRAYIEDLVKTDFLKNEPPKQNETIGALKKKHHLEDTDCTAITPEKTTASLIFEELKRVEAKYSIKEDLKTKYEQLFEQIKPKLQQADPPSLLKKLLEEFSKHDASKKELSPFYTYVSTILRYKGDPLTTQEKIAEVIALTTQLALAHEEYASISALVSSSTQDMPNVLPANVHFHEKNPLESLQQYEQYVDAYDYSLRHPQKPKTNTAGFVSKEHLDDLEKSSSTLRLVKPLFPSNKQAGEPALREALKTLQKKEETSTKWIDQCLQIAEKTAAERQSKLFSALSKGLPLAHKDPSMQLLLVLYARHKPSEEKNSSFYQWIARFNPTLKEKDITDIISFMQEFLLVQQDIQQLNRIKKAISDVRKTREEFPSQDIDPEKISTLADKIDDAMRIWKETRQYESVQNNPHLQVFEIIIDGYLRQNQIQTIDNYLDINSSVLSQLLMGAGKSFALVPLIALFRADGKKLSTIMVPGPLLPTMLNDMIQRLGSDFSSLVYPCPEISPGDPLEKLNTVLHRLEDTIAQRGCVIISPDKRHTLFNALTSFMNDTASGKKETNRFNEAQVAARILQLITESEVVLGDEIDDLLKINLSYIVSLGEPKQFPAKEARVLSAVFRRALPILSDSKVPVVLAEKDRASATILSKEQYRKKYLPQIAKIAIEELRKNYQEPLKSFSDEELQIYLETEYITPENEARLGKVWDAFKKASENFDKDLLNQLAGIRSWLQNILLDCLNAAENKDYGIVDEQKTAWATPFEGPNTPASTTFSNPYQLLTYTLQAYKLKRIPAGFIKDLKEKSRPLLEKILLPLQENLKGKSLASVEANDLAAYIQKLPEEQKNRIIDEIILSIITYHEQSIVSDSHKLATGSLSFSGFSGTTYNVKTMSRFSKTHSDIATEAETLAKLHAKAAAGRITVLQPTADNLFQLIKKRGIGNVQALVDSGGWLSSYPDGAEGLALHILSDKDFGFTEVVFHNKKGELVVGTLDAEKKLQTKMFDSQKEGPKKERFSIYGMKYTVGTDIKQIDTSTCLLTTSANMILRDDLQAIFRMRKITSGNQGAFFALNEESKKAINEVLERDSSKEITYDEIVRYFITNQNRKVEKDFHQASISRMKSRLERQVRKDLIDILCGRRADISKDKIPDAARQLFESAKDILVTKQSDPWSQYGSIPRLITKEKRREKDIEQQLKAVRSIKKHPRSDDEWKAEEKKQRDIALEEFSKNKDFTALPQEEQQKRTYEKASEEVQRQKESLYYQEPYYSEEQIQQMKKQFEADYPIEDLPEYLPEHDGAQVGLVVVQAAIQKTEAQEKVLEDQVEKSEKTTDEKEALKKLVVLAKRAASTPEEFVAKNQAALQLFEQVTKPAQQKKIDEMNGYAKALGLKTYAISSKKVTSSSEAADAEAENETTIQRAIKEIRSTCAEQRAKNLEKVSTKMKITAQPESVFNVGKIRDEIEKLKAEKAQVASIEKTMQDMEDFLASAKKSPLGAELAQSMESRMTISAQTIAEAVSVSKSALEKFKGEFQAEFKKREQIVTKFTTDRRRLLSECAEQQKKLADVLEKNKLLTEHSKAIQGAIEEKTKAAQKILTEKKAFLEKLSCQTLAETKSSIEQLTKVTSQEEKVKSLEQELKNAETKEVQFFHAHTIKEKIDQAEAVQKQLVDFAKKIDKITLQKQAKIDLEKQVASLQGQLKKAIETLKDLNPKNLSELQTALKSFEKVTIASTAALESAIKKIESDECKAFTEGMQKQKREALQAQLTELAALKTKVESLKDAVSGQKAAILRSIAERKAALEKQQSSVDAIAVTSLDSVRKAVADIESLQTISLADIEAKRMAAGVLQANIEKTKAEAEKLSISKDALLKRAEKLRQEKSSDKRFQDLEKQITAMVASLEAHKKKDLKEQSHVDAAAREQQKILGELAKLAEQMNQHSSRFCEETKTEARNLLQEIAKLNDAELKKKVEDIVAQTKEENLSEQIKALREMKTDAQAKLQALESSMAKSRKEYEKQRENYIKLQSLIKAMGGEDLSDMPALKQEWFLTSFFNYGSLDKAIKEQVEAMKKAKLAAQEAFSSKRAQLLADAERFALDCSNNADLDKKTVDAIKTLKEKIESLDLQSVTKQTFLDLDVELLHFATDLSRKISSLKEKREEKLADVIKIQKQAAAILKGIEDQTSGLSQFSEQKQALEEDLKKIDALSSVDINKTDLQQLDALLKDMKEKVKKFREERTAIEAALADQYKAFKDSFPQLEAKAVALGNKELQGRLKKIKDHAKQQTLSADQTLFKQVEADIAQQTEDIQKTIQEKKSEIAALKEDLSEQGKQQERLAITIKEMPKLSHKETTSLSQQEEQLTSDIQTLKDRKKANQTAIEEKLKANRNVFIADIQAIQKNLNTQTSQAQKDTLATILADTKGDTSGSQLVSLNERLQNCLKAIDQELAEKVTTFSQEIETTRESAVAAGFSIGELDALKDLNKKESLTENMAKLEKIQKAIKSFAETKQKELGEAKKQIQTLESDIGKLQQEIQKLSLDEFSVKKLELTADQTVAQQIEAVSSFKEHLESVKKRMQDAISAEKIRQVTEVFGAQITEVEQLAREVGVKFDFTDLKKATFENLESEKRKLEKIQASVMEQKEKLQTALVDLKDQFEKNKQNLSETAHQMEEYALSCKTDYALPETTLSLKEQKEQLEKTIKDQEKTLADAKKELEKKKELLKKMDDKRASYEEELGKNNIEVSFAKASKIANLDTLETEQKAIEQQYKQALQQQAAIKKFLESKRKQTLQADDKTLESTIDKQIAENLLARKVAIKDLASIAQNIKTEFEALRQQEVQTQLEKLQEMLTEAIRDENAYTLLKNETQAQDKSWKKDTWKKEFRALKWTALEEEAKKRVRAGASWEQINLHEMWMKHGVREAQVRANARDGKRKEHKTVQDIDLEKEDLRAKLQG